MEINLNKKIMSSSQITITINEVYLKKLDLIVDAEYTDRSKLFRKWIDQNFKEEYKQKKL